MNCNDDLLTASLQRYLFPHTVAKWSNWCLKFIGLVVIFIQITPRDKMSFFLQKCNSHNAAYRLHAPLADVLSVGISSSCEPCSPCMAALVWAVHVLVVYMGRSGFLSFVR